MLHLEDLAEAIQKEMAEPGLDRARYAVLRERLLQLQEDMKQ
jgi:hypothetical protein